MAPKLKHLSKLSGFLKLEPECNGLQDTPGIYEEGAVADAVTSFVKKGAKEYMEFEQASPACPPRLGPALTLFFCPCFVFDFLLSHVGGAVCHCACLSRRRSACLNCCIVGP